MKNELRKSLERGLNDPVSILWPIAAASGDNVALWNTIPGDQNWLVLRACATGYRAFNMDAIATYLLRRGNMWGQDDYRRPEAVDGVRYLRW